MCFHALIAALLPYINIVRIVGEGAVEPFNAVVELLKVPQKKARSPNAWRELCGCLEG
jgi:hypothetical protein